MVRVDTTFGRIKAAIAKTPAQVAVQIGLTCKGQPHWNTDGWSHKWLCPMCDDKSGSATFTTELFLHCHQCSAKADIFDWLSTKEGSKPWETAKKVAEIVGVPIKTHFATKGRQMPGQMTEEVLAQSVANLWEGDGQAAVAARDFLESRKLSNPRILEECGIGLIGTHIVFASRDEYGRLYDRYRGYDPLSHGNKWRWFGRGTGGPNIWPAHLPPTDRIVLVEGEWDVLTARVRLGLQGVFTWSGGASGCPTTAEVPTPWHGKDIWIGYDNDVFQGPHWRDYYYPNDKARQKTESLRRTLMMKICPVFRKLQCKVSLIAVPVSPKEKYGADLRDWVDEGGTDIETWRRWEFDDMPPLSTAAKEVAFDEVFALVHSRCRTKVQVDRIRCDTTFIPTSARIECPMNQHAACTACPVPRKYPDQHIDLSPYPREIAVGATAKDPQKYWLINVLERPRNCPRCELVPDRGIVGSIWAAVGPSTGSEEEQRQRQLQIVSLRPPSLSGEIEVEGVVYPDNEGKSVMLLANRCESLDRPTTDPKHLAYDLKGIVPGNDDSFVAIEEYLEARWRDLSCHVTRVYGRQDLQITHDLIAHSATGIPYDGHVRRGWLDTAVFGDTRSGKSETFRRMMQFHGLGTYYTAVSNISRAGLVMGGDSDGLMKPGLFPKAHRKMLVLDEWHFLCDSAGKSAHPMHWLQSARDEGKVSGVKIYGDRVLPAKVRFCTIANWAHNKRGSYEDPVEHLLYLYGAPEMISRLDFAISVEGLPTDDTIDDVKQEWTADRTRSLVQRAWTQKAKDIKIEPEAAQLAKEASMEWRDVYAYDEIPLYTPEEKALSIIRIATSIANLCFSTGQQEETTLVRKGHVEWAIHWLQRSWKIVGYDKFSAKVANRNIVDRPLEAEVHLCVSLSLDSPEFADVTLTQLLAPFTLNELSAVMGKDHRDVGQWISRAQNLKIFQRKRRTGWALEFCRTRGGTIILDNILHLARNRPELYVKRFARLKYYMEHAVGRENMLPLDMASPDMIDESSIV